LKLLHPGGAADTDEQRSVADSFGLGVSGYDGSDRFVPDRPYAVFSNSPTQVQSLERFFQNVPDFFRLSILLVHRWPNNIRKMPLAKGFFSLKKKFLTSQDVVAHNALPTI
jgi:hypothetical protein